MREDQQRRSDGKFGSGAGDTAAKVDGTASPAKVEAARDGWLAKAKGLPAAALAKAKSKVETKFAELSDRYGKTAAYAIVGAGIAAFPLPGGMAVPAAMIGVCELHKRLSGKKGESVEPTPKKLTPEQIDKVGKEWIEALLAEENE